MKIPFDKKLFNLTRLDIVASLESWGEAVPFTELRDILGLTDGNLSNHLRVLEAQGIVEITKKFESRKPLTEIRLTYKGESEFRKLKSWFYHTLLE